jgi:hypothetical protein
MNQKLFMKWVNDYVAKTYPNHELDYVDMPSETEDKVVLTLKPLLN